MKQYKAILINPSTQTVEETLTGVDVHLWYNTLDCEYVEFTVLPLRLKGATENVHVTMICDEEGLLKEVDRFSFVDQPYNMQPFAGKCLLVDMHVDDEGNEHLRDVTDIVSADDVRAIVNWC